MRKSGKMTRIIVPPKGSPDARIAIVGEQPGRREALSNRPRPFIGPAGRELQICVKLAGLSWGELYRTNVIKEYKRSQLRDFHEKGEFTQAGRVFVTELQMELEEHLEDGCRVAVACGGLALQALTGRIGIGKWAGSILDSTLVPGLKVVPTFHPATVIPPKCVFKNRHLIIYDLKKAREIAEGRYVPTEREIRIGPSYQEILDFLGFCRSAGESGKEVGYDIETIGKREKVQMSCISFSVGLIALSIPFVEFTGRGMQDYFPVAQETTIMCLIAEILEDPNISKVGQNLSFDASFLLKRFGIRSRNLHDTMVAQNILMSEYDKGLHFVTRIWTDHPYYKDDGKEFFQGKGKTEKGWRYNATDSIICTEALPRQLEQIEADGNTEVYEETCRMIPCLAEMQDHGLRVDLDRMVSMYDRELDEALRLQRELNQLAGRELNPNSPAQIREYFYGELKLKPYRKKGKVTVDEEALQHIQKPVMIKGEPTIRAGAEEANIILEIRHRRKLAGTYLDIGKVDADGRYRCSYNPVGTKFSRLSSSATIFGTGSNLQNWPHRMMSCLMPDEGHVFYSFDLSQAENRIVAYVSDCKKMIDAFENGDDVHAITARMIMRVFTGSDRGDVRAKAPVGNQRKKWRDLGKRANHGLNYDLSARSFANKNDLTETEARKIVSGYHDLYPEVRNVFQKGVRVSLRKKSGVSNLMGRFRRHFGKDDDQAHKMFYAFIPQSTVGDFMNKYAMNFAFWELQERGEPIHILTQVHDSIGFQIPIAAGWKKHAELLLRVKKSMETPMRTLAGREFVIPVDLEFGQTLNKGEYQKLNRVRKDKGEKEVSELSAGDIESAGVRLDELLEERWNIISDWRG